MTLRLNEKEEAALKFLSDKMTYSGIASKAVRTCIMFTFQCVTQLKDLNKLSRYDVHERLDRKYNTQIDAWQYK